MGDRASVTVTITNELGMHARPVMAFTDLAASFSSEVRVARTDNGQTVDGKATMAMLTLMLLPGTTICIEAEGEDAPEAVDALVKLVESSFGE